MLNTNDEKILFINNKVSFNLYHTTNYCSNYCVYFLRQVNFIIIKASPPPTPSIVLISRLGKENTVTTPSTTWLRFAFTLQQTCYVCTLLCLLYRRSWNIYKYIYYGLRKHFETSPGVPSAQLSCMYIHIDDIYIYILSSRFYFW